MGGVEDNEPPLKRVKVAPGELRTITNHLSLAEFVVPHSDIMARPLPSQRDEEMVGSKGIIRRTEFVRIITKALYSLGYEKSGQLLEAESGIPLHSSLLDLFWKQVLDGNWDGSLESLRKIGLVNESILKTASLLILEQKFFELLIKGNVMDALCALRSEITPLCTNRKRVNELSSCIISSSQCALFGFSSQDMVNHKSRFKLLEKLQELLPPAVTIPEKRLEQLVEQALNLQKEACIFHNTLDHSFSLYTDHQCGRTQIPSQTLQVLQAHHDEVWFLQFSNSGQFLASSSKDQTAIIWEVDQDGIISLKHILSGHQKPIFVLAWSPDDSKLLTCGTEEVVKCWDVNSGQCLHVFEKPGLGMISCCWSADGKKVFSGLMDKSICQWDLEGKEVENWKGRVLEMSDMAIVSSGQKIITMCKMNAILLLDFEAQTERFVEEVQTITSFSLSGDHKFLLVSLVNQEIHLWSIENDPILISSYTGHKRTRFIIRSCFGGYKESFIASGSEDSQVYIWLRRTGELIEALSGHSGAVNCVSWNPKDPHMLASASDDHTIRIWGLKKPIRKRVDAISNNVVSNGIVPHCNGNVGK